MNNTHKNPPRLARWLLFMMAGYEDTHNAAGDLEEEFCRIARDRGNRTAVLWYWSQVLLSIPSYIKIVIYWSFIMFRNYLTVALRNILRNKSYSLINISGLVTGLAFFILAALYAAFEFSYDKFHHNADRIYGIVQEIPVNNENTMYDARIPAPLQEALLQEIPEIEDATSYFRSRRRVVSRDGDNFFEDNIIFAGSNFFTFFSFELVNGNPNTVLSDPYSVVLTETAALKYFREKNPVGRTLTLDNKTEATVTGVSKKVPPNSGIKFDFIISIETARAFYNWMDNWKVNIVETYVLLPNNMNPKVFSKKLQEFKVKHFADIPEAPDRLFFFSLSDYHSQGEKIRLTTYRYRNIPFEVLYWFIAMAVSLLLVVSINFMNLSTARYTTRAKEVGMRKVIGANRRQLISQFLGESVILAVIALPPAVIMYGFLQPAFKTYMGYEMDIALMHYPGICAAIIGMTILLGLFAGSYPAFYLSRFAPVRVLKGRIESGKGGARLRKILVVSQFSLSVLIIILTLNIRNQLDYLLHADFGFNRDNIYTLRLSGDAKNMAEPLKEAFMKHADIVNAAGSSYLPLNWGNKTKVTPEGYDPENAWIMSAHGIDYDFIELLDMKIQRGRSFSRDYNDRDNFIINETAAQKLQWDDPLGKELTIGSRKGLIIGVAKDFYSVMHMIKLSQAYYTWPRRTATISS